MIDNNPPLTTADRAALELAMNLTRAESSQRAEQLALMVVEDGWQEAAEFASFHCQKSSLHLKPWEMPPCEIYEDEMDSEGGRWLQRMLDAGISRYHPDPLGALEAAAK